MRKNTRQRQTRGNDVIRVAEISDGFWRGVHKENKKSIHTGTQLNSWNNTETEKYTAMTMKNTKSMFLCVSQRRREENGRKCRLMHKVDIEVRQVLQHPISKETCTTHRFSLQLLHKSKYYLFHLNFFRFKPTLKPQWSTKPLVSYLCFKCHIKPTPCCAAAGSGEVMSSCCSARDVFLSSSLAMSHPLSHRLCPPGRDKCC